MKHIAMLLIAASVGFTACKKETTKCWDCMMYYDKTGQPGIPKPYNSCSPNEVVFLLTTPYVHIGPDTLSGDTLHWVCNEK